MGNHAIGSVDVSDDGRYLLFGSSSTAILPDLIHTGQSTSDPSQQQLYRFDRTTGTLDLVTRAHTGAKHGMNNDVEKYLVSADGRFVAFESRAMNVVAGMQHPARLNVYLYDGDAGSVSLISRQFGTTNVSGTSDSRLTALSADGKLITMSSSSTNFVQGVTYSVQTTQLFMHDQVSNSISLVSHSTAGPNIAGNNASFLSHTGTGLSADGRYIAYQSRSTDLVPDFVDRNGKNGYDVYLYDRIAKTHTLISRSSADANAGSDGTATGDVAISADGSTIAYRTSATDVLAGFVDANNGKLDDVGRVSNSDIFAYDLATATTTLVSRAAGTALTSGDHESSYPLLSADGRIIAFQSEASDLVAGVRDANGFTDPFLFDRLTGTMTVASKAAAPSVTVAGVSMFEAEDMRQQISLDGRYAVFTSEANHLIPGQIDANANDPYVLTNDVFLHDRLTGAITLVSRAAGSAVRTGNVGSGVPVISGDGRYVAYASYATDLVPGFVNSNGEGLSGNFFYSGTDIYLFDRITGTTELVSRKLGTTNVGGNKSSGTYSYMATNHISISDNGQFIAYTSHATDLTPGFTDSNGAEGSGGRRDVYLYDRATGTNQLVSRWWQFPASGAYGYCQYPTVTGDGSAVFFLNNGINIIPGFTYSPGDFNNIYRYDRATGAMHMITHAAGNPTASENGSTVNFTVSADGRFVAFSTHANNLVAGVTDLSSGADVYVHDSLTGERVLVSHSVASPLQTGDQPSGRPVISADGRTIAYLSMARDLVEGFVDTNGLNQYAFTQLDLFAYDRLTGTTWLVTRAAGTVNVGHNDPFGSSQYTVSGDGRYIAFTSGATTIMSGFVPVYNNTATPGNVYIFDTLTEINRLVTPSYSSPTRGNDGGSYRPTISRDGRVIYFTSQASDLVVGDYNGYDDIYWASNEPPQVTGLKVDDGSPQRSVVRSLTVTFDRVVTFADDPEAGFTLLGANGAVGLSATVVDDWRTTVTLKFTGPLTEFGSLIDGNYQLTFAGANLVGGGVDYTSAAGAIFRLFGDGNGDRRVDFADFLMFRAAFGSSAAGNPFDRDRDGDVDFLDFVQFRARFGTALVP